MALYRCRICGGEREAVDEEHGGIKTLRIISPPCRLCGREGLELVPDEVLEQRGGQEVSNVGPDRKTKTA